MLPDRTRQAEPLCKFGPGGDFVAGWEPELSERQAALARLLGSAVETLAAKFGLKRAGEAALLSSSLCLNEPTVRNTEKLNDAIENNTARDSTNAASAPANANDSEFPGESLLFPDLGRNGLQIRHQPKYRIRASRRTAKKGAAFRIPKQGSLFEGQLARARIA
jgi:hypothetical protein